MRLLIDPDPGVDDGVALVMALSHPGARVEALTVVHGNVAPADGVRNARLVVETCGGDVPVYAGAQAPLVRPPAQRPRWLHGADGFGDIGRRPRRSEADAGFAPDRIVELVMANPGAITLVALGPLTNLAVALAREPRLAGAARELVIMGGAARLPGTTTPAAEFNIHTDPEAARVVFAAGFRLTMVGIDLCRADARLTEEDVDSISAVHSPVAALVSGLLGHSLRIAHRRPMLPGEHGAACADAVAMAAALDGSLLTACVDAHVAIETHGELTTGMPVVDWLGLLNRPANCRVGLSFDAPRFKALLLDLCRQQATGNRQQ